MTTDQDFMRTPDSTKDDDSAHPYGDDRSRIYKASGGSRKNSMLLLMPHPTNPVRVKCWRFKQFSDIRDFQAMDDGSGFRLDFSDITAVVTGRNLTSVALAIGAHSCSRIEAFNADRKDMPTDPDQPFIETITYHTRTDEIEALKAELDATRVELAVTKPGAKPPKHEPETRAKAGE